jgi:hypothetical protein
MINDDAPEVRRIIAERLPASDLAVLRGDHDWLVRYAVAERIAITDLGCLLNDPEPDVQAIARERLNASQHAED